MKFYKISEFLQILPIALCYNIQESIYSNCVQ